MVVECIHDAVTGSAYLYSLTATDSISGNRNPWIFHITCAPRYTG